MKFHRCVTQEYAKRGPAFDLDGETDESGVFPELVNKATGLGIEIRHLKVAARQGDLSSSSSRTKLYTTRSLVHQISPALCKKEAANFIY